MHWRTDTGKAQALDFGMRAPAGLRIEGFPLSGTGIAGDLSPWEREAGDRNVPGAKAIAVPAIEHARM